VLGFLGPNGAGKSTTMKMLDLFYTANIRHSHRVRTRHRYRSRMEVTKKIGYLPENNPACTYDMYVREYLEFVAGLHKMGAK
jgi:ABC-2 type transport system ATP-binding protein